MKFKLSRKIIRSRSGFSLIELMVVIAIIGIIVSLAAQNIFGSLKKAQIDQTRIQMKNLMGLLEQFNMDCNTFPTEQQGLDALAEKPADLDCRRYTPGGYVKDGNVPLDGFSKPFEYRLESGRPVIVSFGADGREGGTETDADIFSNEDNKKSNPTE
jgi:general secretion pathway protein G